MFFGNEKINRKSCSEEKKVRRKITYFYGLESGLGSARRKLFRGARRFIGRRRGFRKFSRVFSEFFWNFLQFFWKISTIFWKISPKFLQFFSTFAISLRFFRKFLPTTRYGSTGVSPYCKFTIKFTPKFTLILIKILQSTKFEGSHFYSFLATFIVS